MQEVIVNVLFIAVLVVIIVTLGMDVLKKRKRLKTAQAEEEALTESLQNDLPEGYVVLKDVFLNTLAGRSRADYVIISPYGIFALEYRQLYIYIRADELASRWTYAPGIKGKPFTSPLFQSQVHLYCIEQLIGDKPGLKTYPMCAFPTIAEIELKNSEEDKFVGLTSMVIPFIEQWQDEVCLSTEEIKAIAELLTLNSKTVKEMEKSEPVKGTPEEYKVFIPLDYVDPEEEDDEDDEDDECGDDDEAQETDVEVVEEVTEETTSDGQQDFTEATKEEVTKAEEDFGVTDEGPMPAEPNEPSDDAK